MKKINLLLMMFASLTLFFATSCGKDKEKEKEPDKPVEITLKVSGGTDVTLMGADIAKDVTVTASEAATKDIIVSLSSDAAEGEASFTTPTITIKQGEKTAIGKITFVAAKFPKGTDAKKITVTIKTTTENVKVDVSTTDFSVKGEEGKDLPGLTITANGTTFNTTTALATFTATFTLTAPIDEELAVTLALGAETSDDIRTAIGTLPVVKIPANQTTATYTHDIAKGVAGKLALNFTIENEKVKLNTPTLSATFTVDKPVIEPLCAISAAELNKQYFYVAGFKIGEKTVNISADDPAYMNKLGETIADIAEGGEVKVFAVGNGDPVYVHVWVDWNKDNQVTENEIVGATDGKKKVPAEGAPADENFLVFNFKAPAGTAAGSYSMRIGMNYRDGKSGCDNDPEADESRTAYDLTINYTPGTVEPGEDPTFSLEKVTTGNIEVPTAGDKTATFNVKLSKASDEAQTISLGVETDNTGKSGVLSVSQVVIPAKATTSEDVTITFASDVFTDETVTATVTVTGTSETLEAATESIVYNVAGTAGSGTAGEDLELYIYAPAKVYFTEGINSIDVSFNISGQNKNKASEDIVVTPVITGATIDADYTLASNTMTIKKGENSGSFKITVLRAGAGKNIKIDFTTDLVTFKTGYNKFTTVTSETYSVPENPADYKVQATLASPVAVNAWNAYLFQVTNGTQEAPVFVTITAKADDIDVTSKINFENKKVIALLKGRASGYFQVDASLSGKTIVFTFTSDDTNFLNDTASVTVE